MPREFEMEWRDFGVAITVKLPIPLYDIIIVLNLGAKIAEGTPSENSI